MRGTRNISVNALMHSFMCDCVSSNNTNSPIWPNLCVVPASRLVAASPYLTCTWRKIPLFCKMYKAPGRLEINVSPYPLKSGWYVVSLCHCQDIVHSVQSVIQYPRNTELLFESSTKIGLKRWICSSMYIILQIKVSCHQMYIWQGQSKHSHQ